MKPKIKAEKKLDWNINSRFNNMEQLCWKCRKGAGIYFSLQSSSKV